MKGWIDRQTDRPTDQWTLLYVALHVDFVHHTCFSNRFVTRQVSLQCAWFLQLTFLWEDGTCVYAIKPLKPETSSNAFCYLYKTLATDITEGCDLSNKACHELLPKKRGNAVFSIPSQ